MFVTIKGGSKRQKELAESMVVFCQKKLMPKMYNLEINMHIKEFGKDENCGYAWPADDAHVSRPREFNIEVNRNQKLRQMLETIAHEMVHVKQFARGELYESTNKKAHRWQGIWMSNRSKNVKDYWDNPWEIEAFGRQLGLFIRWAEENDLSKYKWTQLD